MADRRMPDQSTRHKVFLPDRLKKGGPKKLLALDGGGIRGVLSLEILRKLESLLRSASGRTDYRLADYFDYISGTSTGGIIAAGLAIGKSVDEILEFYEQSGAHMFKAARILDLFRYRYQSEPLAKMLKSVFGENTQLGSEAVETLLLLMMRNATTDSPWPISNNPFAKYNDSNHSACHLKFPLWQLVRASTAAPTYFPPEKVVVGGREFIFVDGGITVYNNPAFQMFLMATVDRYWINAPAPERGWPTGPDKMLIVSVGTGTNSGAREQLSPREMNLIFNARTIHSALMFAALNEQDFLCRVFGDCVAGDPLDREVDTMIRSAGPLSRKLFRYVRYNAELTRSGLDQLGCTDVEPQQVQQLDSIDSIPALRQVGKAVADGKVQDAHLNLDVFAP
jgi:Patatin-like phospholipase